jgi:hypothetical protein
MEVGKDHEPIDWDAAWEALVLTLQRPRHRGVAVAVGQALVALAVIALSVWLLLQLVAEPLHHLAGFGA